MNIRCVVLLAVCSAVLLAVALPATAAEPNGGQNQAAMQSSGGIIRNSTLMGATVLNAQNQQLGQIKDLLLDRQTGQATFVVLDARTPATDHAMLVVPYQALRVHSNPADNRLSVVLDLRPEQLRAAPQIQNNQWQMIENPQFLQQARNFYQAQTYLAARPTYEANMPPAPVPMPCFVPQPCVNSGDAFSDWPQSLIDFSSE